MKGKTTTSKFGAIGTVFIGSLIYAPELGGATWPIIYVSGIATIFLCARFLKFINLSL